MNPFDQKIKNYAHYEPFSVPYGFDDRIDKIVDNLPARSEKRFLTKTLMIASVFLLLSTVTVMASPSAKKMAEGVISYFNAPQEFRYEIPFEGNITVIQKNVDVISKKVANLYGESNPKIVKVKPFSGESANVSGYIVVLEGNFSKDGKKASTIEFSMLVDGTKVWGLRGYNEGEGKDIWLDNEVSI